MTVEAIVDCDWETREVGVWVVVWYAVEGLLCGADEV